MMQFQTYWLSMRIDFLRAIECEERSIDGFNDLW